MKLRVRVPATTANLGPGCDCLGLALNLWNTIMVEESSHALSVKLRGESENLPADKSNVAVHAMSELFAQARVPFPAVRITMTNRIPIGRGLGSSAAAIVGGLVAANAWLNNPFSSEQLLALATKIEGHPDNVSAALLGGLTIVVADGERLFTARVIPSQRWRAILFIPEQALSTKFARKILPRRVSRTDAIFNIGRAALLVNAFAQHDASLLDLATRDRLHQPYRARLVLGMNEMFDAARESGAQGVALSGAGPSLIAFAQSQREAKHVAHAWQRRARELQIHGEVRVLKLSAQGAQINFRQVQLGVGI